MLLIYCYFRYGVRRGVEVIYGGRVGTVAKVWPKGWGRPALTIQIGDYSYYTREWRVYR